ncbi:MAG: hypothetical protein JW806_07930 [Sedimentisphaerales bacterium]|nr:hypothetical protein [Sedimentisphaerales bacterium]
MTDSQIFQLLGIIYFAVGIGMLVSSDFYRQLLADCTRDSLALYLGGLVALGTGFIVITFHNVWVRDWSVIITLFGWAAMIKGIFLIVAPKALLKVTNFFKETEKLMKFWAVVVLVLGAILSGLGFFATIE